MAMSNFQLGEADALDAYPFCPEYLLGAKTGQAEYAQGFLSVKSGNAAALAFVGNVTEWGVETTLYTYVDESSEFTAAQYEYLRNRDKAADEAQYTPRAGYDF